MNTLRFSFGIILLIIAVGLFLYMEDIRDTPRQGLIFKEVKIRDIEEFCNSGWGDVFGVTWQCIKLQLITYSPYVLGIVGIILIVKAGSCQRYKHKKYYR